jgi:bacterioferritin
MAKTKKSTELMRLMNEAIAREMQVSIQYMWQHVLWYGVKGFAVKDVLKKFAIVEMKHAEAIAERLAYFGGAPTIKPSPIVVGKTLKQMITQDQKDEEGAIVLYNKIIKVAEKAGDIVTMDLFKKILADEEDHHDTFCGLLEEM